MKKCLNENDGAAFGFENLIPNPLSGVINRRNGCGTILFKKCLSENGSWV
ncbi:hypothetical protein FXW07_10570 [Methanosarcina sp. DH1]|nr:hypothetical protein [Methanosarcina sp. DH1]MCC4767048.1 hypothetical protein [Methanosarcina sp. DH1]